MNKKEELLALIHGNGYRGMHAAQLSRALDMEDSASFTQLMKLLNDLEAEHILARDAKERYFTSEELGYVTGTLRINPKGFGFVETADTSYYIGRDHLGLGMDRDIVFAKTWTNNDKSVEGEVIEVLEHSVRQLVGTVKIKEGRKYFLSDAFLNYRKVRITNFDDFRLVNDSKVLLGIDSYGTVLKCHIEKEIGYKYDPGIDILSVLLEKDINPQFPEDVMQEVQQIPETIQEDDIAQRKDLRKLLTITIDGEDAKDLDDAISVEKLENNKGYRLYVHIADVSHYVRAGSAIDQEAYARGTSVYVVDRVVPMLPHALCNGICSLNPRVDRLTLTCCMDIDKKGEIDNYKIYPSIICSDERMTYKKVNAILAGDAQSQKEYPHLLNLCLNMKVLSGIIRRRRERLGAIDFDTREAKILVDEKGNPTDIVLRERGESERIIEDFMIAANECVAMHMKWMEVPSMYRIHEAPEPKKMRDFATTAKSLGYNFQGGIQNVYPAQLQSLLNEARGQENYFVLSSFMLRAMQKARYDNRCIGHFGLALKNYLHFTSPIRRYPDLVVHRMLRRYIFTSSDDVERMKQDELWCEAAANQASERERNAVDAEREVDDMKKAQYMERFVGHMFDGVVSGITKFGMFVELENTAEGFQHELLGERLQGHRGPSPSTAEIANQGTQRSLAVVARRGVEPCGLVPVHCGANRRAHDLPEQVDDFRVVRKLVHPRDHIPIRTVVIVVDDRILGIRDEIDLRLAREHVLRVETEEHLAPVVKDSVVDRNQITVGTALDPLADGTQDCDRLVHASQGHRFVVRANQALQSLVSGVVASLVFAVGLVDSDIEVPLVLGLVPKNAHAVVQLPNQNRNLQRVERRQAAIARLRFLRIGITLALLSGRGHVLIRTPQVVLLDAIICNFKQLDLDGREIRRQICVDIRQIRQRHGLKQVVVRYGLTFAHICDIIYTVVRYRPVSVASAGAVFFLPHNLTSLMNPVRHQIFLERLAVNTATSNRVSHHYEVRVIGLHQRTHAPDSYFEQGRRLGTRQERLRLQSRDVGRVFLHRQLAPAENLLREPLLLFCICHKATSFFLPINAKKRRTRIQQSS